MAERRYVFDETGKYYEPPVRRSLSSRIGNTIGYALVAFIFAAVGMTVAIGEELKKCERSGGTYEYRINQNDQCVMPLRMRK